MKNKKLANNILLITYWTTSILFLFVFLFFLARFRIHSFFSVQMSENGLFCQNKLERLLSSLDSSTLPADWWDLDHAPEPALQSLKAFRLPNGMQGEFYFFNPNQNILLSNSDLPIRHSTITVTANNVLHTPVYQRSSDGTYVISFYRSIDVYWILVVDIPVAELAACLQELQTPESSFYLIDDRSNRMIASPDSRDLSCSLDETDSTFLQTLSAVRSSSSSDFTTRDEDGNLCYGHSYRIGPPFSQVSFWSAVNCYRYDIRIILRECWGLAAFYLLLAGLVWTMLCIYVRKERNR